MVGTGLLTQLTALLEVPDPLTRLNAVELLTALALTHQGIRFRPVFFVLLYLNFCPESSVVDPDPGGQKLPTKIKNFLF